MDMDPGLPNRAIFRLGYDMSRFPFPCAAPVLEQAQRHRRRFVCAHPCCGKAFTTLLVAKQHQRTHEAWYAVKSVHYVGGP
jgi:hypothetical protein